MMKPAQHPRYDPEVYHERQSPTPIADVQMDHVALQHELLKQQERLLMEAELTRRFLERSNRAFGSLSLLMQKLEAQKDRRVNKGGIPRELPEEGDTKAKRPAGTERIAG